MIEIEIPNDITKVEFKFMGLITKRQAVCLVVASVCTMGMRMSIGADSAFSGLRDPLTLITAGVPLLFSFKVYGMKMEEFLKAYLYSNILSPTKRKYKIDNKYSKEYEKYMKERQEIRELYYKHHKKPFISRIGDKADIPLVKKNKKNPEITGYV